MGFGFIINNKSPLKKENSYAWSDFVVPEILAGIVELSFQWFFCFIFSMPSTLGCDL